MAIPSDHFVSRISREDWSPSLSTDSEALTCRIHQIKVDLPGAPVQLLDAASSLWPCLPFGLEPRGFEDLIQPRMHAERQLIYELPSDVGEISHINEATNTAFRRISQ